MQDNKIISMTEYKSQSQQELIDDIGARAFLFLRDAAEELGLPMKEVISEHMLGLTLVVAAVEGKAEARNMLQETNKYLVCDE